MNATPITERPPRPAKPAPVLFDNIPADLKAYEGWVLWAYTFVSGKWTKPLLQVYASKRRNASSTDPSTWSPFRYAKAVYEACYDRPDGYDGVGYVLGGDDGVVLVDLDHCVENGVIRDWALNVVRTLDSYTEWSPSHNGIHILTRGALPAGHRTRPPKGSPYHMEVYSRGRYTTITGHRLEVSA